MSLEKMPRVLAASEVEAEMAAVIVRIHSLHDGLVATVTPSTACFANVCAPWIAVSNEADAKLGMIRLLSHAAQDQETRHAASKANQAFSSAAAAWMARTDLFDFIKAAAARNEDLDPESKLWVEEKLRDFVSLGHGSLQGPSLDMFISQRCKLEELKTAYERNLREEGGGVAMTREELSGVSEELLRKWKQDGHDRAESFFVPFGNGGWSAVMRYAHLESSRRRMFLAEELRMHANVPLFRDIVLLRDSQARILGYSSHGDFRLQGRAIKSAAYIESLLRKLRETLIPKGRQELQHLEKVKAQMIQEAGAPETQDNGKLAPWDLRYYSRLANMRVNVNDEAISEFFPLETTVQSMLKIFERVLQLVFKQVPPEKLDETTRWHEDVQVWEVWDAGSNQDFMGFLYLDLFWRKNKKKGAENISIGQGFLRPDGSRQVPSTVLMCCIPQPAKSCALLRHSELVSIFHELGHGVHNLVSKTKYARFHGTSLPFDFIEVPSMLLENWCWIPETLQQMSCHYTSLDPGYLAEWRTTHPGEPDPPTKLPAELQRQLLENRDVHRGLQLLYHLVIAMFDVTIHNPSSREEAEALNMQKLWYDLREELEGIEFSSSRTQGHGYTSFDHLVSGYDMGFYSYLSCSAIAQDIFQTVFEQDPWDLDAWARYREGVLQPGGSQRDPISLVTKLLGREPDFQALAKSLAI
ncbi:metallopeptidase MepB [Cordyceps militaris CM01]|uniref:Metallopeptidase MepB n=1 Tax=Cordyceps militaris (strain CM01) TaxID=983644 RepID=G3JPN6_CORMM|nr:metallopeptidase MepB [Cordyceps militaris CM01]EGX89137.1 metallopeptidase MepB [Cordyceps militaris CM01]